MAASAVATQARAGPAQQTAAPAQSRTAASEIGPEHKRSSTQVQQWLSFLGGQGIRPSLAVSPPDSPDERAADRLAEAVLKVQSSAGRPPGAPIPPCSACAAKQGSKRPADDDCPSCAVRPARAVRRMPLGRRSRVGPAAPSSVHRVLGQRGGPLPPATRAYFEPRFGVALDHVRVHTDAEAARSAGDVGAHAYAVGSDIVFAERRFAPGTAGGNRLLAHELAHVVLDGNARVLRRDPDEAAPLSRSQEIAQSRSSPGMISGQARPLTLSLWNFGIDVATLKPEHRAVLQELGQMVSAHGTRTLTLRAIGFTDETGPEEHNLDLSRRRAQAVSTVLAPLAGRVRVTAFGESNPASDNATVDGRSRNRRVDLRLNLPPPPVPVPTPVPQPTPQPTPEPPGGTTPTPDPPPRPPPPETTRPPPQEDPTFCEEHPILCGLPILPTLPFLSPLLCLVAPELCAGAVCVALPELCLGGPDGPPDPPERRPPDDDDRSGPRVHFIPDVAASNSPAGMPDRIGLRDPVRVTAVVGNPPPPTQPITISVSAPHTAAGNATIDGGASVNIAGTTVLSVLGSQMTQAAVGPHLQLQAAWQSNLVGWSNSFAVSSIAENWWIATTKPPSVGRFGPVIFPDMHFLSDSGNTRDLNECTYVEAVAVNVERGGMTGFGIGKVNDPNKAESCEFPPAFDEHGTPFPWITRPGYSRLNQLWRIHDARAGSGWVASPRSGFTIERIVERDTTNPRCWQLTVRKRGAAVSAYGLAADEGSGDFAHTFRGINCTAPPPRRRDPPPPPPRDVEPPPVPEPRTATPTPQAQAEPQCDRVELARRVDACIEEARQGAIECTARVVLGGGGGWRGVLKGLDYWTCIDDMRTRLLECDREAKRDTHCMGVPPPDPSQVKVAEGDSAPDDDEAFG